MTRLDLPRRPRILVITLRRLGDVLLATPLIRSLRRAWPQARIDALVFADTAGILEGNPDLDRVVTIPPQPSTWQTLALGARLFRRYDLAISTQSGDRPTGFAIAAGRMSVAPVAANLNGRVKRALLDAQRRCRARLAPGRGNVAARRRARHRARARTGPAARCRGGRAAGRSLRGNPCGADVPLQAMDRCADGASSPSRWPRAG